MIGFLGPNTIILMVFGPEALLFVSLDPEGQSQFFLGSNKPIGWVGDCFQSRELFRV